MNSLPVKIGDQVLVERCSYAQAYVREIFWLADEARFQLNLSWKLAGNDIGTSKVYSNDYQKVWFKFLEVN